MNPTSLVILTLRVLQGIKDLKRLVNESPCSVWQSDGNRVPLKVDIDIAR